MKKNQTTQDDPVQQHLVKRRSFLKWTGASALVTTALISSCDDSELSGATDLGSGDVGLLNYLYVLEYLQAEFYSTVTGDSAFTTTFSEEEQSVLTDMRDHEGAHRAFIKNALGIDIIEEVETSLDKINLSNRTGVLNVAKELEDLGVAAYNGVAKLFTDANLLLVSAKIASVEARHASVISDLISPRSADFASDTVVDQSGFGAKLSPQEVLDAMSTYFKTKFKASNLPTT